MKLSFSFPEYEVLKKHHKGLEKCFHVHISLPNFLSRNHSPPISVIINIRGEPRNVKYVKKFVEREMLFKTKQNIKSPESVNVPSECVPVITIDDDEDFSEAKATASVIEHEKAEIPSSTTRKLRSPKLILSSLCSASNQDIEPSSFSTVQNVAITSQTSNLASSSTCSSSGNGSFKSPDNNQSADDSIIILSEVIVPSSTKQEEKRSMLEPIDSNNFPQASKPLPEFIPLRVRNVQPALNKKVGRKKKRKRAQEAIDRLEGPAPKERRILRPIVIDGSNVARFHGKPTNTFSCKGIKICVDYFLKRGHTNIKVLLPHYKRYDRHGPVVTTDGKILDELEKSNMVVYTPSRTVNKKRITCYDDRFIVSLAAQNNGVIVSNDNYRDIMNESEEFKKTIMERLLMFCFADDIIMIPEDPLGVTGPKLSEFLSMRAGFS